VVTEKEEFSHLPGDHPEWNESHVFTFYDPSSRIGFYSRIGYKPNKGEGSGLSFIYLPDGRILLYQHIIPLERNKDELEVGELTFLRAKPMKEWKITFNGRMTILSSRIEGRKPEEVRNVRLNVNFRAINLPFDYRECATKEVERIAKMVASEHYEQAGIFEGILEVEGVSPRMRITGLGERDHTWGIRDWAAPKYWIWLTAQFSENLALNITKLVMDAGEVAAGYIFRNGKNVPIREAYVESEFEEDGLTQKGLQARIIDFEGISIELNARVIDVFSVPYKKGEKISVLNEAIAEYELSGRKGYGMAEYLLRVK